MSHIELKRLIIWPVFKIRFSIIAIAKLQFVCLNAQIATKNGPKYAAANSKSLFVLVNEEVLRPGTLISR